MDSGMVLRIGSLGGILCVAFYLCGDVSGDEVGVVGPDREGAADTETHGTVDPDGKEALPLEWISEIMENQEMLESLDLLDKFELFREGDRFSPHRFE